MTIELTYTGAGYIPNVPARDLTAAEAAQYGALIAEQEAITHTPMYEVVPQAAPQQAAATPKGKAAQTAQEVSNG